MPSIFVNGQKRDVADHMTVSLLAANLQLSNKAIAIAVNQVVIPRQTWAVQRLYAGDQVDVVKAIGGG